jgi:RNA polymerase sigma-70 factor (ECF subfamily)
VGCIAILLFRRPQDVETWRADRAHAGSNQERAFDIPRVDELDRSSVHDRRHPMAYVPRAVCTGAVRVLSVVLPAAAAHTRIMHARYEDVVLPHLDAAHRTARWLLGHADDADDAVQEASLRALRYFHTFVGGNGRAWFLRIVRNVCSDRYSRPLASSPVDPFDEEQHSGEQEGADPESLLIRTDPATLVGRAINNLPVRSRELLRLRELEGLSYRELARAVGVPMGTVMSGLSRARQALRDAVEHEMRASD